MKVDAAIASVTRDECIATWNGVLIQIWRRGTPLESARMARAAARRMAAEQAGAITSIVIVEPTAEMPDSMARAELSGMAIDQTTRMACVALVHEGTGFRVAMIRAVMTGLMLVAKQTFPHGVFAEVDQACAWMAANPRLDADDMAMLPRVVENLRAMMSQCA